MIWRTPRSVLITFVFSSVVVFMDVAEGVGDAMIALGECHSFALPAGGKIM